MFSFVKKINPFRRDPVPIQNELSRMKTVEKTSQTFHSAQQCHCSKTTIDNGENMPGHNVVDSAQRKGINKLLKEFEKENIKVATLMDQDGRIFFSIEVTDIIRNDEELNKIARVVQESIQDSSGLIMSPKEGDEVYKTLKKHFLFESARKVTLDNAVLLPQPEISPPSTQSHYVSIINSEPGRPSKSCSEKTLVDVKPCSSKLFTISTDESELNTILYKYIISKLKRKKIIKRRKRKKNLDLPIDTLPSCEDRNDIEDVSTPKNQVDCDTKNILLTSFTKLTKEEGGSQIIQRKESTLKLTAEITKCKAKQKANGIKKRKDSCMSLQMLKKQIERKLKRNLLSKERRKNRKLRDNEQKEEPTDQLKKHGHHKDKHRRKICEKHDRNENRPKTTNSTKHCKLSSGEIEGKYIQHEMRLKKQIPTRKIHRRNASGKADIEIVAEFVHSSSRSKEKTEHNNSLANFNENDIQSEEINRRREEALEFENDPSEKLIAVTTFE